MNRGHLLVAVTGASGTVYAHRLLADAVDRFDAVSLVVSRPGAEVARREMGWEVDFETPAVRGLPPGAERVRVYGPEEMTAPFASGSSAADAMIIIPCSAGTAGRIAAGTAESLITRAAAVMLKERRPLLLVVRETPLSLIDLRNLTTLAEAGARILPASPSFYHAPETLDDLVGFFVARLLDQLGLALAPERRWGAE